MLLRNRRWSTAPSGRAELERLARAREPAALRSRGIAAGSQQLVDGQFEGLDWIRELRAQVGGKTIRRLDQRFEAPRPRRGQRVVSRGEPEVRFAGRDTDCPDEAGTQVSYVAVAPLERPHERKGLVRYIAPAHPPQGAVAQQRRRRAEAGERREPFDALRHVASPQQHPGSGVVAQQPPRLNRPRDRETSPSS